MNQQTGLVGGYQMRQYKVFLVGHVLGHIGYRTVHANNRAEAMAKCLKLYPACEAIELYDMKGRVAWR
jgi:Tfp pilus assembly ATPase PilU